jgi:hypothetical protein
VHRAVRFHLDTGAAAAAAGAAAAAAEEDDEDCDEGRAATTKSTSSKSRGYNPVDQHVAQNSAGLHARSAPRPVSRPRQPAGIFTTCLMEPTTWHRRPVASCSRQPA